MSQPAPNDEMSVYRQLIENYQEALKHSDEAYNAILEYHLNHVVTLELITAKED